MNPKQLFLISILTLSTSPVMAQQPNWIMDTSDIGNSHSGVVHNNQILELGHVTPSALQLEGEAAMRTGNLERALTVLQRSVEMAPLDMDKRILYAQALEKKLLSAKQRDPALFNFVVKQWLFISKKAEFPDQGLQGRAHVMHLTGSYPKMWEKTDKWLSKVLIPEDGSEKVQLGGRQIAEDGSMK